MSQVYHTFEIIFTIQVLIYTAGHINYGGRITDDWDRRFVLTMLEKFYNEKVLVADHQFDDKGFYNQVNAQLNNKKEKINKTNKLVQKILSPR